MGTQEELPAPVMRATPDIFPPIVARIDNMVECGRCLMAEHFIIFAEHVFLQVYRSCSFRFGFDSASARGESWNVPPTAFRIPNKLSGHGSYARQPA